jgi:hypothetical protein
MIRYISKHHLFNSRAIVTCTVKILKHWVKMVIPKTPDISTLTKNHYSGKKPPQRTRHPERSWLRKAIIKWLVRFNKPHNLTCLSKCIICNIMPYFHILVRGCTLNMVQHDPKIIPLTFRRICINQPTNLNPFSHPRLLGLFWLVAGEVLRKLPIQILRAAGFVLFTKKYSISMDLCDFWNCITLFRLSVDLYATMCIPSRCTYIWRTGGHIENNLNAYILYTASITVIILESLYHFISLITFFPFSLGSTE